MGHKEKCDCEFCQIHRLRFTLTIIHTWATYDGGIALDPLHVASLCEKTLKM